MSHCKLCEVCPICDLCLQAVTDLPCPLNADTDSTTIINTTTKGE